MRLTLRALMVLSCLVAGSTAFAQTTDYPRYPIHIVVPYPPGGGTDIVARLLAEELQKPLGQTVIVDNRSGATGRVGAAYVSRADPDGYTLLIASQTTQAVNPAIYKESMSYDAVNGFTPIALAGETPLVLVVNGKLPVNSVSELIAYIRKNPTAVTYATSGTGSTPHMAGALFNEATSVAVKPVPFRGEAPGIQEVIAGRLTYMFCDIPVGMPFVKSGMLKVLGVTSPEVTDLVPGVPTVASAGLPGFNAVTWFGLFGPAKLPPDIVTKISDALRQVAQSKDLVTRFAALGYTIRVNSPEDFATFVRSEQAKWDQVVTKAGIKAE